MLAGLMLCLLVPVQTEREHQARLAPKYSAKAEIVLWDDTRVDLLSQDYAIEIDFGPKWGEAIGQALYYSIVTGKPAAIILLVKSGEERFAYRCQTVCARHGIRLFVEKI